MCLSGAHAATLLSVQRQYEGRMEPKELEFTLGGTSWTEPGYAVEGKHLSLANSALRSQPIVRAAMLWGYKVEELTDSFTDRAFVAGYNIVYDTMGHEPNRFLKSLIERARRCHPDYKVVIVGAYAPWEECKARCLRRGMERAASCRSRLRRRNST